MLRASDPPKRGKHHATGEACTGGKHGFRWVLPSAANAPPKPIDKEIRPKGHEITPIGNACICNSPFGGLYALDARVGYNKTPLSSYAARQRLFIIVLKVLSVPFFQEDKSPIISTRCRLTGGQQFDSTGGAQAIGAEVELSRCPRRWSAAGGLDLAAARPACSANRLDVMRICTADWRTGGSLDEISTGLGRDVAS